MLRQIDYSNYDSTLYGSDHPGDPIVLQAITKAQALAEQLIRSSRCGTELDRTHYVDQGFDLLRSEQGELLRLLHEDQQYQLQRSYLEEQGRVLLNGEQAFLQEYTGKYAGFIYRENMKLQASALCAGVHDGTDTGLNDRLEQLWFRQAAQKIFIFDEIDRRHEQVLHDLKLSRDDHELGTVPTTAHSFRHAHDAGRDR